MTQLTSEEAFDEEVLKGGAVALVAFVEGEGQRGLTMFEKVAEENAGKLKFFVVQAGDVRPLVQSLGLNRLPSFVLFREGEVLEKSVGPAPRQILQVMLSKHV